MGKVKLFPTAKYTSKQPRDPIVPRVPCTGIFLGPSKSGKTVALISAILDQYMTGGGQSVFERIYIFSPSIEIDDAWKPVKGFIEQASEGFATAAEAAAGAAEAAAAAEAGGGALALLGEGALATAGAVGAATGGLAVAGAGAALVGTAWAIEGGLNAASHLMGWGAATGGGTDSDASRPSMTTDVQTLNGTQESGAVDHYFIQEQRRAQRPEVFRIDTESESEPRQIRSRPARRPRPQAQTPFGLNNVPIPVSSGSERSRVSRQSRGDRGPLGTQPSFEALRQASEPEAA